MNIPLHTLIGWGVTLFTIAGAWYNLKNKVDGHSDKSVEHTRQIEALWKWHDESEKSVSMDRLSTQKDLGALQAKIDVHDGQFNQILSILSEIKQDIRELKQK